MAEKVTKAKAPAARKTATKKKSTEGQPVSHDDIRQLAHQYWAERGHPDGEADIDWLRAEQELRGKAS